MLRVIPLPLLALALLAISPSTVYGHLDETAAELESHLGTPVPGPQHCQVTEAGKVVQFGEVLNFRKDGWSIVCTLLSGRCCCVSFHYNGTWSEDVVNYLLNSNVEDFQWRETTVFKSSAVDWVLGNEPHTTPRYLMYHPRTWVRSDGTVATLNGTSMELVRPDYTRTLADLKAKANLTAVPSL